MKRALVLIAAIIIATAGVSAEPSLKLQPKGFGKKSFASWKANEGYVSDNTGGANTALYLQKLVPTSTSRRP